MSRKTFPHDGTSLPGHGALRSRSVEPESVYAPGDVLDTEHGTFAVTEVHPAPEGGEVSYSGLFQGGEDGMVFVREVRGLAEAPQDDQNAATDGPAEPRASDDPAAALASVTGPSTPAGEDTADVADEDDEESGEPAADPFAAAVSAMKV